MSHLSFISQNIISLILTVTFLAASSQSSVFPISINAQIFTLKFVTAFAVGLAVIVAAYAIASMLVFNASNRLNMRRIYTMSNAAQVVAFQVVSNFANKYLVDKFMTTYKFITTVAKSGITSLFINKSRPFPTWNAFVKVFGRFFDLGKDAGKKFTCNFDRIIFRHNLLQFSRFCSGLEKCISTFSGRFYYTIKVI